ncbi:MAG TPA: hypothetical protein VEA18_00710 [Candidatus Kapabacteria bacterium]|nr:hypothetical protein [Candidatus Kapabacteria bacterium]
MKTQPIVQLFRFEESTRKPGRVLSSVRIGDVYMSRLTIEPGITTGNYFHKKTKVMFYVERGDVLASFEHVKTGEKKKLVIVPDKHVIHVPPFVAHATKNVGKRKAVLVFFSNKALRSEDCFDHRVL